MKNIFRFALLSSLIVISFFLIHLANAEDELDVDTTESDASVEMEIDTVTIYEMPEFSSNSLIDLYRPVKLPLQKYSIPRPLKLTSYSEGFSVLFEQNTKVTNRNGVLIAPIIYPPRKTLPNSAKVPKPEERMLDPFFILIGNPCNESTDTYARQCTNPVEYFSPEARLMIPMPENMTKDDFNLVFFDTEKWAWERARFTYDEITDLITVNITKAGYVAFTDKSGNKAWNKIVVSGGKMSIPIPDGVNQMSFSMQYFNTTSKMWKQLDFTIDEVNNYVQFKNPESGLVAFMLEKETKTDVLRRQVKESEKMFADIEPYHWVWGDIEGLIEKGVLTADKDKNFRPEDLINRAEVAKVLTSAFDLPFARSTTLEDVPSDIWFANDAKSVVELGIMYPYLGNTFEADTKPTKAEALVAVLRAGRVKIDSSEKDGLVGITDVPENHRYAAEIGYAVKRKMVAENLDVFDPNAPVTRAQFMKMINRILNFTENTTMNNLDTEYGTKLPEEIAFKERELAPFRVNFENWESNEPDILRLKKVLYHLGYFNGSFNKSYDSSLEQALTKFQIAKGIFISDKILGVGRFGDVTRKEINKILPDLRDGHIIIE